jgi:NitT/TauT family transport system ATP-binding protein
VGRPGFPALHEHVTSSISLWGWLPIHEESAHDGTNGILDECYPHAEAERQFAAPVDWGRYAELLEYDTDVGRLCLAEVGAPI